MEAGRQELGEVLAESILDQGCHGCRSCGDGLGDSRPEARLDIGTDWKNYCDYCGHAACPRSRFIQSIVGQVSKAISEMEKKP